MTLAEKLQKLLSAYHEIKEAVSAKGVEIPEDAKLSNLPELIEQISDEDVQAYGIEAVSGGETEYTEEIDVDNPVTIDVLDLIDHISKFSDKWYDIKFTGVEYAVPDNAFSGCTNIVNVELPETLIRIGDMAFDQCTSLEKINLPEHLDVIGSAAFRGCTALNITKLPDKLSMIYYAAFEKCNTMSIIKLPDGLLRIENYAFNYCNNINITELPENLRYIGKQGFRECFKLSITEFPESLTYIGDNAFRKCTGLTNVTFKSRPSIASDIFYDCTNLKEINVPWSMDDIPDAPWGAINAEIHYNYTGENQNDD